MASTISKLNKYKSVINVDDFIDYLYSQKIIDEINYYSIWSKRERDSLYEIFRIIDSKENVERIFEYLDERHPNIGKQIEEDRLFRVSSVRGGFPKLPPNYVSRTTLVEDLRSKLLDLQWDQKLVIHGMMGYGKSCLVNEVLNDKIIRKYFDNYLFWINLGDCHDKENILQPMWRLYTTASNIVENRITHYYDDVQILKDLLIELFLDPRLKNALIILDDICSQDVLTYFDIKCKTVITTQNKNILSNEEVLFLEVKTGFSKLESLELFKKSLKISHDLPIAAEEVHSICQGHPMLIALIGSYLSENAEDAYSTKNEIWEYIKNMFLRGNYRLNEYSSQVDIAKMIKKCIEKLLTNSLKDLYQDLAIFAQDVNIPPEVLEILWNKNHFEVRNVMNKFAEKSLVVPFYHKDLKTYIYAIHDIHLNYLKETTAERAVSLHKKLINGYDRITKGNYALLPNDNYTLQFIGYHLLRAEAFDKFCIYFDLKFLEAKIKAVGKEDVLRDIQRYEIYITRNENILKEKIQQYKDFINRCGANLFSYEKTDIIQYALRESKDSFVFKEARKLAESSQQLYFQLQRPVNELDYSQIINISDDITSACFVDSPQQILIGTTNGKIKLFYEQSAKEISSFVGHSMAVKKLHVSPDKRYFLSVSEDGTVILWKFAADSSRNSRDYSNHLPVSPKTKQMHWQDVHTPDKGQVTPKKKFQLYENDDFLISAAFCSNFPDVFRIVTGSHRGNVIIWDAQTGSQLCKTGYRGIEAPCVLYQTYKSMDVVIFSIEDAIYIYELKDERLTYFEQLHNGDNCTMLFYDDNEKIIAVSEHNLTLWQNHKSHKAFEKIIENKSNICSTLTNDCKYLVVSTNQNTVYIWSIEERRLVQEFENKGLAKSLDTFYDEDKSVHILLIGSDRKTLQQCHIQPYDKEPVVETVPVSTPFWKKTHALTAIVSQENRIQIFSGYVQISETEIIESQVTCTCFSACGSYVIYGLENGEVHLFNVRTKTDLHLEDNRNNEQPQPITYLKCYDLNSFSRRTYSISSCGSGDCLDFNDFHIGIIISITNNDLITVYNYKEGNVLQKSINHPLIFYKSSCLILVDADCKIYIWDIEKDSLVNLRNTSLFEPVKVTVATFCIHKSLLAVVYIQTSAHFLDVYRLLDSSSSVELCKRIVLNVGAKSACFSSDGSLLVVGMMTGEIKVWNLSRAYQSTTLHLHKDPVQDLVFSPSFEPVLVSLGEEIAWWNLKPLQVKSRRKGRPLNIEILEDSPIDINLMNMLFWSTRRAIDDSGFLLSCMKLHGKAKYVSASNDFNSFLTVDDKGKIYIMEIVHAGV